MMRKTSLKRVGFKKKTDYIWKVKKLPTKPGSKTQGKVKTLSKWKKELDAVFSRYIRYRDKGQCYTCPKNDDPKYMQCGHFVPRQYLAVRFDERNCNCQCYACNMLYNGQPSAYAINLKRQYGEGIIEELESNRQVITKLDSSWYILKIQEYTDKLSTVM